MKNRLLILIISLISASISASFFISPHYTSFLIPNFLKASIEDSESIIPNLDIDTAQKKIQGRNQETIKFYQEMRKELIAVRTDFIEINFEKMEVLIYEKGVLEKEYPILARGDLQSWGGTAVGLYKVLSKDRAAYSAVAEVYMPYSVHFYGKYYIHGEPYYPSGEKSVNDFTGGCVRVDDNDAKEIYEFAQIGTNVLVIDEENNGKKIEAVDDMDLPDTSAESWLAADLDSGQVFGEKNSKEQLPIASVTKLMTALVVAENVDLKKSTTVDEKELDAYGSTEGLSAGSSFRVVELFYPLLIESSNDAAEVVSGFLGRAKTIRLMNEKAKEILMANTEYVCPSGYDPGNKSTARDLFYLARYIANNKPQIFEIAKAKPVTSFGPVNFPVDKLWNKNVFVADPSFIGGKTGFILASHYTGVFVFNFSDKNQEAHRIAIIILGAKSEEGEVQRIYKWLCDSYSLSPKDIE